MASTSLKTLVLRNPCQQAAGLLRLSGAPKACFSTARPTTTCLSRTSFALQPRGPAAASVVPRTFARSVSNEAKPTADMGATPAAPASSASAENLPLDWNHFFQLRLKRRRYQLACSVTSGVGGGFLGALAVGSGAAEPLVSQAPLDPFFTMGILVTAFAALGWLIGPSIGSQVFYALNRKWKKQVTEKEAQFFARIRKHRSDPTNSSAGNPVPDFYGEKIQSVSGYRQWLKDQKAFNKKKTANFL